MSLIGNDCRIPFFFALFDLQYPLMQNIVYIRERCVRQGETKIMDTIASGDIQSLIMRFDGQLRLKLIRFRIDIVRILQQWKRTKINYPFRKPVKDGRIRFKMDEAAGT